MEFINGTVTTPLGFSAAGVICGVKASNTTKRDVALIYSEVPCAAAGIYTLNKVQGAPILVTKEHLQNGRAQAVICNSGNANTCNADGVDKARAMAQAAGEALGIPGEDVIVASTGVIGQPLNLDVILQGIPALAAGLGDHGTDAAEAIMTTDTVKKEVCVRLELGGKPVTIGAIAKGSGMIHPNMGTMLSFITTDCAIAPAMLQKALRWVGDRTYNMVSIDGDTSTNDTLTIMANGLAGNPLIDSEGADYDAFVAALYGICEKVAKMIAKDGEGASRMLECHVYHAADEDIARKAAKSVITSSLVKAAFFGADANWGRILCALGYCDAPLDVTRIDVTLTSRKGEILVCRDGAGVAFSEEKAKEILLEDEIGIEVDLKAGEAQARAWGCDLTYKYVEINGDYRT
ncbi:MAG: bifunctional glutamate N-acetyltransferase/amino-acid acetyltransferase ArgJ [Eubacteriales bacterium]|jgi:glutamate N-acetyltransferase/amino-acid N-acetyltransferase